MKEVDIKDNELIENNHKYIMLDIENLPQMIINTSEVFGMDDVLEKANELNSIYVIRSLNKDIIEKEAKRVLYIGQKYELEILPEEGVEVTDLNGNKVDVNTLYMNTAKEMSSLITKIKNKYPDKNSTQYRLADIMEKHLDIVMNEDLYREALYINPLYNSIISTTFSTFPEPLFAKEIKDAKIVSYEKNEEKFEELIKGFGILDVAEKALKFMKEETLPYLKAKKEGKLTPDYEERYQISCNDYMKEQNKWAEKLASYKNPEDTEDKAVSPEEKIAYKERQKINNLIDQNRTLVKNSNAFELTWKKRNALIAINYNYFYNKMITLGWPVDDIPIIREIQTFYIDALKENSKINLNEEDKKAFEFLFSKVIRNNDERKELLTNACNSLEKYIQKDNLQGANLIKAIKKSVDTVYNDFEINQKINDISNIIEMAKKLNKPGVDTNDIVEYLYGIEEKYTDEKCVERRLAKLILNHINLVTLEENYKDAIKVEPIYSQVFDSSIAAFPIPIFKNDDNDTYKYDMDKYNQLLDDLKILEAMESAQTFFKNVAIPFTNEAKSGPINDKKAADYYDSYKGYLSVKSIFFRFRSTTIENVPLIKNCKTYKDNDFTHVFNEAFAKIANDSKEYNKSIDKGWPFNEIPFLKANKLSKIPSAIVEQENKKLISIAGDTFEKQGDNKNKIDVLLRYRNLIGRRKDFNDNGYYEELSNLSSLGIYGYNDTSYESDFIAELQEKVCNLYSDDYEGRVSLLQDFSSIYVEYLSALAKEREANEKFVLPDDPDKEKKVDYITCSMSANILKLRAFDVIYQKIVGDYVSKDISDYIRQKIVDDGKDIKKLTIKQVLEYCGDDLEYLCKFIPVTVEHLNDNFYETIKNNYPDSADFMIETNINSILGQAFSNGIMRKIIANHRNNLFENEKRLFDKADNISKGYYAKLIKEANKDTDFGRWARNDGDKIVASNRKQILLQDIKEESDFFLRDKRKTDRALDFSDNAKIINDFYKILDDNTHWYKGGSSRNFDKMMNELEKLKTMAYKFASSNREPDEKQLNEYVALARKVEDRAAFYLEKKAPSNSLYAAKRVSLVTDIKNKLADNIKSFENYYIANSKNEVKDLNEGTVESARAVDEFINIEKIRNTMFTDNIVFRKLYQGDAYNDEMLEKMKKGTSFSVERNAIYSIAIAYLLAQVDDDNKPLYTYDDIMSMDKLVNEKKQAFDIVAKKLNDTNSTDKNVLSTANKWLADIIYKGQKASVKVMDEELGKIDFSDEAVFKSERFIKARTFSFIQYDLWQEMANCKDELMEYVKKDHPNIVQYSQYKDFYTDQITVMSSLDSSAVRLYNAYCDITADNSGKVASAKLVSNGAAVHMAYNLLKEWNDTGKKKTFSKWCAEDRKMMAVANTELLGLDIGNYADEVGDNEIKEQLVISAIDRSLYSNIKYIGDRDDIPASNEPDPNDPYNEYSVMRSMVYSGLPTCKQLDEDKKIRALSEKDIIKLTDKSFKSIDSYMKKIEQDESMSVFAKNAKKAVKIIEKMLVYNKPIKGETFEKAKTCIRHITAYNFAKEFKKAGYSGKKLKLAVKRAMSNVPALVESMDYVGVSTLHKFAYGKEAKTIVKNSNDSIFVGKAAVSLSNLNNEDYKGRQKDYLKDAAYAMTAQQLRVNGKLVDEKTKIEIKPDKYVQKLIDSKKFKDSLKSGDPKKLLGPKVVAKMAMNDKALIEKQQIENAKANANKVNEELRASLGSKNSNILQGGVKK